MNLTELRLKISQIYKSQISVSDLNLMTRFVGSDLADPGFVFRNICRQLETIIESSGLWLNLEALPEFEANLMLIKDKQAKIKENAELVYNLLQMSELSQIQKIEAREALDLVTQLLKEDTREFMASLSQSIAKKEKRAILKKVGSLDNELLFHGIKIEYAEEILSRQSILGYTTQRYWEGGKRYKEDDEEYQKSFWMRGISMTRDLDYAVGWASVVLVFDRKEIITRHKVESYNWSFSIKGSQNHKKESEDFVILKKTGKTYLNKDDPEFMEEYNAVMEMTPDADNSEEEINNLKSEFKKRMNYINTQHMQKPEGEFEFGTSLKGIILKGSTIDIYGIDDQSIQSVLNHPLFMGILED